MSMITISMPPSKIFDMDDEAGFDLVYKQKVQKLPHALMDAIGKLYHHLMNISPQLQPLG